MVALYNVIGKNASSCKLGEYAMMFNRDKYLNQLINSKENGFPKVITGIRRCGKSYLLNTIYRNYLIENGIFTQIKEIEKGHKNG